MNKEQKRHFQEGVFGIRVDAYDALKRNAPDALKDGVGTRICVMHEGSPLPIKHMIWN